MDKAAVTIFEILPVFVLHYPNQFGWHYHETDPIPFLPPSHRDRGIKDRTGKLKMSVYMNLSPDSQRLFAVQIEKIEILNEVHCFFAGSSDTGWGYRVFQSEARYRNTSSDTPNFDNSHFIVFSITPAEHFPPERKVS